MTKQLDYNVIASGSSGNAVRIENIMIDCGIPYKEMLPDLMKVDTLLITHGHSDHVNHTTYAHIRKDFPRIRTYGNADVGYRIDLDVIVGTAKIKLPKRRIVIPFEGSHDIPVTGYIIQMKGMNIFYMTDSFRTPDFDIPIDYCFCESNYDERKLHELAKQYRRPGYDPVIQSMRHLSTQKCKEFYYIHRRNADSPLIELHKSKRFY